MTDAHPTPNMNTPPTPPSSVEPTIRRRKLSDYRPDPDNANKGSERGRRVIRESFEQYGPGRSLLADSGDVMIAGNQAMRGALEAGIEDVIEIEPPPGVLVVVKRSDLDLLSEADQRARELAYADNRSRDFAEWDAQQLLADLEAGVKLDQFFRQDELDDLLADGEAERLVNDNTDGERESASRLNGDRLKQVKPVLYVEEISTVEAALAATGLNNRGQAFLAVCRAYLETKAKAETKP